MTTRKDNQLESLDEAKRSWILELAQDTKLIDLALTLRENGIETSTSSLSRFVRRHQEQALLEAGNESKLAVEELAMRGKEGLLREGTLEAVRQRLYEQTLASQSPEAARQLYAAMVKEEAKLKELELEARKIVIAEEELKLKALTARAALATRAKAEVVDAAPEVEGREVKQLAGPSQNEKRLWQLVNDVSGILNRGGDLAERMLEARAILTEGLQTVNG